MTLGYNITVADQQELHACSLSTLGITLWITCFSWESTDTNLGDPCRS